MLVSVVTVVLNAEQYIEKTLESVLAQSYDNLEYIVIDGGSTDATVDIIKRFAAKIDFWSSEADLGISDALNKGIKQCHGEIIGLINAGDWYDPETVSLIVRAFAREKDAGVACGALQFWQGESKEYLCQSVPGLLASDMTVTHPTCFVKKSIYDYYGVYSVGYKYAMDYEFLLRVWSNGVQIISLAETLAHMQHQGISEKNWYYALRESHRARKKILPRSIYSRQVYFLLLVAKRGMRILLERLGFLSVIGFYRTHIALVRKVKTS